MNKIKKKLYVCFIGTYDRDYSSNRMILRGFEENGIKVLEVNAHTPVTKIIKEEDLSWWRMLKRVLVKTKLAAVVMDKWAEIKKTDVFYVGYPGHLDVLLIWPLAKMLGKKIVFNPLLIFYVGFSEEQGILNKESLMGKLAKWGEGLIYRLVDIAFADTPYQEKHLRKLFGIPQQKMKVLPIGADERVYRYSAYNTRKRKSINVVYYGLYSPIHGVEHLVEAARLLRGEKGIKFTMVGKGNTYEATRGQVKKYGLKNFEFYPEAPEDEQIPLLQQADVFLGFLQKHPSVERIIPNKVYQGLALGKVVLTADAPVTRSLFEHKRNMYLVKAADPKAIAQALIELRDDYNLRIKIAKRAYELFESQFSAQAVGSQLIKYLHNLDY